MVKKYKTDSVQSLKEILQNNPFVVVLEYKGLTAQGVTNFRGLLKAKKANMKVFKNTLSKLAMKDTPYSALAEYLKDQVAISYSNDCVGLSSVLMDFTKANEAVKIRAGFLEDKVVDISTIKQLSSLGSLEDVRAAFLSRLSAPASNLVRLLKAPSSKLSTIMSNYMSSKS